MCVRRRVDHRKLGFKTWNIPYITRGAFGTEHFAGHAVVFGVKYSYNQFSIHWATTRIINFWGLMKITHEDDDYGSLKAIKPGFNVKFCRPRITLGRVY